MSCLCVSIAFGSAQGAFATDEPTTQAKIDPARNRVSIHAGPSFWGYRLRGSGFNATLPLTSGSTIGLRANRDLDLNWRAFVYGAKTGAEFSGLTGLTPSAISLRQYQLSLGFSYDPKFEGVFEGVRLEVGYGVQWSRADLTSPNAAVSPNDLAGPTLGVSYEKPLRDLKLRTSLTLWFAHWFRETRLKTGSVENLIQFQWSLEVGYPVTQSLTAFMGTAVSLEKQGFSGSGDRGVTNAGQTTTIVSFPIRLEVQF